MFHIRCMILFGLICEALLLTALPGYAWQQGQQKDSMAGMNMSGGKGNMNDMADMKNVGPSMAAMAGHMTITPVWPKQPGDEARAKQVVAEAKATMEHYKNYLNALAEWY